MRNSKQRNRELKLTIISLFLFHCVFSLSANCQSVSTISAIYDYEIDDIFHTRESGSAGLAGFVKYANIQITNKYYSTHDDTLFYICDVKTLESSYDHPEFVIKSFPDTIVYTNLDSLINHGNIDTVYFSGNYNDRKVNYDLDTIGWSFYQNTFIDGCGGPYYYFNNNPDGYPITSELKLLYFKKGSEEWGESFYVSVQEPPANSHDLTVYPNPSTEKIVLACKDNSGSNCDGMIYSSDGKLIRKFYLVSDETNQIDISRLNQGLYIISLKINDNYYHGTFIKN